MEFIDVRPAYQWLRAEAELSDFPRDVIFVLGGASETPLYRAAELFRHGYARARVIAFTSNGGTFGGNLLWGIPEVEHYAARLQEFGVPKDSLVYPKNSSEWTSNTLAEAQAAIPFLKRCIGCEPSEVILCARSVHQRRAWLTFLKQSPNIRFHNAPCEEVLTVELLPRILGEIKRIREYGAKGDLEKCAIPDDVLHIDQELARVGVQAL